MVKKISITLLMVIAAFSVYAQSNNELPQWVKNLIEKYQTESVGNPPRSIWQYEYKEETVYYMPEQCCDQGSELYDDQGQKICSPDGGYAGGGDGKCADFFTKRKNKKLIWKDSRKHE